ncbi:RCC1 domain-containing protein [Hymenobacter sp. B1770]|uniref:RCC1 domain-containing protein n=1 Tax=Hymenobacter sp. B1770 TaxID=1718788 RepID=UPI003CF59088
MQFKSIPLWGGLCLLFSAGAATAQTTANPLAASTNHSATIKPDGSLWMWGINYEGQLGNGTTRHSSTPVQVNTQNPATRWTQVATGTSHTLAVTTDGRLYAWGSNAAGQLGTGSNESHARPVAVSLPPAFAKATWKQVAAGTSHSLALTADGHLLAWGHNATGQLGTGYRRSLTQPVEVPLPLSAANSTWAYVAAGNGHTLALTADGRLYAWGNNDCGQLGNGSTMSTPVPVAVGPSRETAPLRWAHVSAGRSHTLAVTKEGRIYTWGSNRYGQLANDQTIVRTLPEPLQLPRRLARVAWAQVAAGDFHSLALSTDGRLVAWGNNCAGQLGDGSTTRQLQPVLVSMPQGSASAKWARIVSGGFHSLAYTTDNQLCTWGCNGFGQLGDGTTTNQQLPLPQDPALTAQTYPVSQSISTSSPGGGVEPLGLTDTQLLKEVPPAPSFMILSKPKRLTRP